MLSQPLTHHLNTTTRYLNHLKKIGIKNIEDLLGYYPRAYQDLSQNNRISQLQLDKINVFRGTISHLTKRYSKTQKLLISAILTDQSASIEIIWFNQPYVAQFLKNGDEVVLAGKIKFDFGRYTLMNPIYEKVGQTQIHTSRIIPVYPESPPLTSKWIREKIYYLSNYFDHFREFLPDEIISRQKLMKFPLVIKEIHFPSQKETALLARERLAFDELLMIQLVALQKRWQWIKDYKEKHYAMHIDIQKVNEFVKRIPFDLTNAQKKVLREIIEDLKRPYPMLRLLQGDVGSGKTIVAGISLYITTLNGLQGTLMAPTEILAKQHYKTLSQLFNPYKEDICIKYLTGSLKKSEKKEIQAQLIQGKINIIIGTHAIIQDEIQFKNLGLAIIDEQHRFGVKQRDKLKSCGNPNLLNMSATPIPRSLAMTLYGDQDISIIDEMPKGRKKIITKIVPEEKRASAYNWIKKQINQNCQVYVICPLIEASDVLEIKSVISEYQKLQNQIFTEFKVGLLHGKLSSAEKDQIMDEFGQQKIQILVSTSVIEVGIDNSNANIIIIEGAERFGLAQLHQFRGRVGRGEAQSYCFLFPSHSSLENIERLRALETYNSGFLLAEIDLNMRGPGELFGIRQSGMPDLTIANITDTKLIARTRNEAIRLIKENPLLEKYPLLKEKVETFKAKYEISIS